VVAEQSVFDVWGALRLRDAGFSTGMDKARVRTKRMRGELDGVVKDAKRVSSGLKMMGGLLVGGGLIAGLRVATREFRAWETGLAKVSTLLDDNVNAFNLYGSAVGNMSKRFGLGTTTVTEGLYQAISASVGAGDALSFMNVAGMAAVGGLTDMNVAVDGLTTLLNSYGKSATEAAHAGDVLAIAQKRGKTTIGEMSSFIGAAAPTAAAFGVTMEQLAASIATSTKAGINTASSVAALRQLFAQLAAPTKRAQSTMKNLGIEMSTQAVKQKGFINVLGELMEATKGNDSLTRQLLGSTEALNVAMVLTSKTGKRDFLDTLNEMETATGELERAFSKMADTTDKKLDRMVESFNSSAGDVGRVFFDALGMRSGKLEKQFTGAMFEMQGMVESFALNLDSHLRTVASAAKIYLAVKAVQYVSQFTTALKTANAAALTLGTTTAGAGLAGGAGGAGKALTGRAAAEAGWRTIQGGGAAASGAAAAGTGLGIGALATYAIAAGAIYITAKETMNIIAEKVQMDASEGIYRQSRLTATRSSLEARAARPGAEGVAARRLQEERLAIASQALILDRGDKVRRETQTDFIMGGGKGRISEATFNEAVRWKALDAIYHPKEFGAVSEALDSFDRSMDQHMADRIISVQKWWDRVNASSYNEFDSLMEQAQAGVFSPEDLQAQKDRSVDLNVNVELDVNDDSKERNYAVNDIVSRGEGEARAINPRFRMYLRRRGIGGMVVRPVAENVFTDGSILNGGA
jgi:TP901 family phage tail tape measure protein